MRKFFLVFIIAKLSSVSTQAQLPADTTRIEWREGYLDIHHILTGSGDCTFVIMPDGTTLMVDAGDIGDRRIKRSGFPLQATDPYPNNSKTAGEWIAGYIRQTLPDLENPQIDYALLTHYHDDHMGAITPYTKTASNGAYKLTGITEVGHLLPIKKIIDRGYPDYNFPTDLRKAYSNQSGIFQNLQSFIQYKIQTQGLKAEKLLAGSTSQLVPIHQPASYPSFAVRGVKVNGTIWTGKGNETKEFFTSDSVLDRQGGFNENPLSLAIKISYGRFDYFTGGDNTGLQGFGMPAWFDVETPMASAVGKVEATTLCHHGCRDAVNENFLDLMAPQTIIHQSWSTNHPGEEPLHRILFRKIKNVYATNIQEETKKTLGFWLTNAYKSTFGHIIIRVLPGGNQYYILIAETIRKKVTIKKVFGPFLSE